MAKAILRRTLVASLFCMGLPAWPQATATEPGAIVVPYPAGGSADIFARIVAPALGKALRRQMVVENISGATGSIGAAKVLAAPADGATLFLGSPTETVLAPLALSGLKYRAGDFRLVGLLTTAPLALYARADLPAASVDELVALARQPGAAPVSYGSTGLGSLYHIVGAQMMAAAGVPATHVPYRGGAPLLQDMMGGTLDLVVLPVDGTLAKMVEGGKLKVLAVSAPERSARFRQTPVLAETRALKAFDHRMVWAGVLVHKDTPPATMQALHAGLHAALRTPDVHRALEAAGGTVPAPMTLEQAAAFYADEQQDLQGLVRSAGVVPN